MLEELDDATQDKKAISGFREGVPFHSTEPVNPLPFLSSRVIVPAVP
jgi:hypothetical protein